MNFDEKNGLLKGLIIGMLFTMVVVLIMMVPSQAKLQETGSELFQDYYACYMAYVCSEYPEECIPQEANYFENTCAWAENYEKYYDTFGGEK